MGIFTRASDFINGLYGKAVESAPARGVGAVVGGAGNLIARASTAAISPILQQGIETFAGKTEEEAREIVRRNRQAAIKDTTEFGQRIGSEGAVAFASGGAGRVANVALATPMLVSGTENIKEGNVAAGALQLGLGALGVYGGSKSSTLRQSASDVATATRNVTGGVGRAVTSPVQTSRSVVESIFKPSKKALSGTVKTEATQFSDELSDAIVAENKSTARVANLFSDTVDEASDVIDEMPLTKAEVSDAIPTVKKPSLSEYKTKTNKYFEAARKAVNEDGSPNPRSKTPIEIEGDDAVNTIKLLRTKMSEAGKAKSDLVKVEATKGSIFKAEGLSEQYANLIEERLGARIVTDVDGNSQLVDALGRKSKVTEASDAKIILDTMKELEDLNGASVQIADDIVDRLQGRVTYKAGALAPGKATENTVKAMAKTVNDSLKDQLPKDYKKLNAEYKVLRELVNWADKNMGPEQVRAGSLIKRMFSPSDAGTKKAFALIKALTGKDHIAGGVLAMEAMRSVGDPRARSLLEGVGIMEGVLEQLPIAGKLVKVYDSAMQKVISSEKMQDALNEVFDAAARTAYENADTAIKAGMTPPPQVSQKALGAAMKEIGSDADVKSYVEASAGIPWEDLLMLLIRPGTQAATSRATNQERTEIRKDELLDTLQTKQPSMDQLRALLEKKRDEKQSPVQGAFE